jgi:2,3,4,5-tetrahydropyridine-2-carboxylate N-succinyltransferase
VGGSKVSLGAATGIVITGGNTGYVLTTDGSGNLSWGAGNALVSTFNGGTITNALIITNSIASTSSVTGALRVSGGVGIGGVLEPVQASPVVIEDDCFIGSRCIVVEGVRVGKQAVLGANVVLTKSTKIIDVSGPEPIEHRGYVPERSVVIPGTYTKEFPAGSYQVPCALIIGQRKASTDLKTSLNDALREHNVAV